jgi:hypothetical protein
MAPSAEQQICAFSNKATDSRLARLQVEKKEFSRERIGRLAALPSERRHVLRVGDGCGVGPALLPGEKQTLTQFGAISRLLVSETRAIASRNAGEDDVLDERVERNCQTGNIAFAVGRK